jgi:hypothetical protein
VGAGGAYQGVLPFSKTRPLCVVAPCHALAAGDQVGQSCAEQRQAAEYAQDVQNGKTVGCPLGLFIDRRLQLFFGFCGRCGSARNGDGVFMARVCCGCSGRFAVAGGV